jgi:hypothetical protein
MAVDLPVPGLTFTFTAFQAIPLSTFTVDARKLMKLGVSAPQKAPAPGQWGTSAPFYNDYRWQRQPAESMSFVRNFRMGKEGRSRRVGGSLPNMGRRPKIRVLREISERVLLRVRGFCAA